MYGDKVDTVKKRYLNGDKVPFADKNLRSWNSNLLPPHLEEVKKSDLQETNKITTMITMMLTTMMTFTTCLSWTVVTGLSKPATLKFLSTTAQSKMQCKEGPNQ